MKLAFRLDIIPPTATAQQKRTCVRAGRVHRYDPKNVIAAKNTFLLMFAAHAPAKPLQGPLRLSVHWFFPWRKSEPKRNRSLGILPHDVRPDLDNLAKALCDCMAKSGFFENDGQIAVRLDRKSWADKPGIEIELEELA